MQRAAQREVRARRAQRGLRQWLAATERLDHLAQASVRNVHRRGAALRRVVRRRNIFEPTATRPEQALDIGRRQQRDALESRNLLQEPARGKACPCTAVAARVTKVEGTTRRGGCHRGEKASAFDGALALASTERIELVGSACHQWIRRHTRREQPLSQTQEVGPIEARANTRAERTDQDADAGLALLQTARVQGGRERLAKGPNGCGWLQLAGAQQTVEGGIQRFRGATLGRGPRGIVAHVAASESTRKLHQ